VTVAKAHCIDRGCVEGALPVEAVKLRTGKLHRPGVRQNVWLRLIVASYVSSEIEAVLIAKILVNPESLTIGDDGIVKRYQIVVARHGAVDVWQGI
jgi:putative ribosome biogenesis GTPase RsgA